jgi:sialic acid synthase SpsE
MGPAAIALGASLYEKHFTLSRQLKGPDHAFALEPDQLRALIAGIRATEQALGSGRLEGPSGAESEEMYRLARRSLVAAEDIPQGTVISAAMLTTKRPGFGVAPKYMDVIVGRRARIDIEFDDVITWEML